MSNYQNIQIQSGLIKKNNQVLQNGGISPFSTDENGYTYKDMLSMMLGSKENMESKKEKNQTSSPKSTFDSSVISGQSYLSVISSYPSNDVKKGDLNGDGKIDNSDSELQMKCFWGEKDGINWRAGDFDNDGEISAADIGEMMNALNEEKEKLSNVVYNNDNINEIFSDVKNRIDNIEMPPKDNTIPSYSGFKYQSGEYPGVTIERKHNDICINSKTIDRIDKVVDQIQVRRLNNGDFMMTLGNFEAIFDGGTDSVIYDGKGGRIGGFQSVIGFTYSTKSADELASEMWKNNSGPLMKYKKVLGPEEAKSDDIGGTIVNYSTENIIDVQVDIKDGVEKNNSLSLHPGNNNIEIAGDISVNAYNNKLAKIKGKATLTGYIGQMTIKANESAHIETIGKNIRVEAFGKNNDIKVDGENNTILLKGDHIWGDENKVEINGENTTVKVLEGDTKIKVNATNSVIDFSGDIKNAGNWSIDVNAERTIIIYNNHHIGDVNLNNITGRLEVEQVGNNLLIKRVNSNIDDFVVSFVGCLEGDKDRDSYYIRNIKNLVDEHNAKIKVTNEELNIPTDEKLYNFPSGTDSVSYTTTGNMNITNIHTSVVQNGKMKVDMDIFNKSCIPGVLEVLDDSGRVVQQIWLSENTFAASSAWDMTKYLVTKTVDNFIDGFQRISGKVDVEYDNASASSVTRIEGLEIPAGTHIRITNSIDQSEDLMAYYIASSCYDNFMQALTVAEVIADFNGKEAKEIGKMAMKEVVKDIIKDAGPSLLKNGWKEVTETVAIEMQKEPAKIAEKIVEHLKDNGLNIVFETAFDSAAKVATTLIGSPVLEKAVGAAFDVADAVNLAKSLIDAEKYRDEKPLHYYFYEKKPEITIV